MRRPAVLLLTLAVAAAAPAGADLFRYLAFGDSITAGLGIPLEGTTCKGPPPLGPSGLTGPECGYPPRLQKLLGCSGADCSVENEGKSGEKTFQGLSRINAVLGAREWDVLLLMEGSNDVFQQAKADIRQNLSEMARKAADRGADTVHASVIWFIPSGKWGSAKDSTISGLRSNIQGLAKSTGRYFADQWAELCPRNTTDRHGHGQGTCFGMHYTNDPIDPIGHPNASGFQMLAERFRDTIRQAGVPGPPFSTTAAAFCNERPAIGWAEESPVRATWYELIVTEAGGRVIFQQRAPRLDWCSRNGRCAVTLGQLDPGDYRWWVRSRNPAGWGPDMATQSFAVVGDAPDSPQALAPAVGDALTDPTPVYSWSEVAGGTDYELEIDGSAPQSYEAGRVCGGGVCSVEPSGPALELGSHSFRVRASNCVGPGEFGAASSFDLVACEPALALRRTASRLQADAGGVKRRDLELAVSFSEMTPLDLGSRADVRCALSLSNRDNPVAAQGRLELTLRAGGRDAGGDPAVARRSLSRQVREGEAEFSAADLAAALADVEAGELDGAVVEGFDLAFSGQGGNRVDAAALDCAPAPAASTLPAAAAALAGDGEAGIAATGLCYDGQRPRGRIVLDAALAPVELAAAEEVRCAVELERLGRERPPKGSLRLSITGRAERGGGAVPPARSALKRKMKRGLGVFDRRALDKLAAKFAEDYPDGVMDALVAEYLGRGGLAIDHAAMVCESVPPTP